ncbi:MAG: hypothetical protein D6681_05280 [Calditrichaeota bacterium]|nr:MAG: hypothetical protein D6681_05280 [Calditrichota bacterium]
MELVQLRKHQAALAERDIHIISVVPGNAEAAQKMHRAVKASFPVLGEPTGRLMDVLGLRHKGGNPLTGEDIFQSASFLIDRNGRVVWSRVAKTYRVRPRPEEILEAAGAY